MAVDWLARRKYPDRRVGRSEDEEAWRTLCRCVFKEHICAYVLTGHGDICELERAQFAGLQERYFSVVDKARYWHDEGQYYEEITDIPPPSLRSVYGFSVCGRICFFECELEAAFGAEASPEESSLKATGKRPLPAGREPELKSFLVGHAREQVRTGMPNDDDIARKAAEEHFSAQISRDLIRKLRREAGCAGQQGRKSAKK